MLYINHEDIGEEIRKIAIDTPVGHNSWFHAGEYSDSLALSHITGEIPYYYELFKELPNAKLEFRTKSANFKEFLKVEPLKNVFITFSLSPEKRIKKTELKTPPLRARLRAIKELHQAGHLIGLHFDPIIYEENFVESYQELIEQIIEVLPAKDIQYISLGVVRFAKDAYHQVEKNYPDSDLLNQEFITSFDQKIRYNRPMRLWILDKVKSLLIEKGIEEPKIYLCME